MIQMTQTNVLKIKLQTNRIQIHIRRTFTATSYSSTPAEDQIINTKTKALGLAFTSSLKNQAVMNGMTT